jgi:hypothetical protein
MSKTVVTSGSSNSWAGETYSPLLVEQICTMLEKEGSRYHCTDYLAFPGGVVSSNNPIDERWRQKSAEWMFKVVDYYDLERDIVNIGMTYLDRMFTETSFHHRWSQFQCRLIGKQITVYCCWLLHPFHLTSNLQLDFIICSNGCPQTSH